MIKKLGVYFILILLAVCLALALPQFFHKNEGISIASGTPGKGTLENAWLIPYTGNNFKYFSPISYYFMDNGYLHHKAYHTILSSYKICEKTCPNVTFGIMECANTHGGKMQFHNTHQNGLSVDFMSPLIDKQGKSVRRYARRGLRHYLLEFNPDGILDNNNDVRIDFETMAKHILSLHEAGKKQGLRIKKVILKINLKDNLFATHSGKILQRENIYFAQALPKHIDDMHDDHYHIDFQLTNSDG